MITSLSKTRAGIPLGSILAHHAALAPSRTAIVIGDVAISYAELDARANRRARMLAESGLEYGDFVTIALPNGLTYYETSFAAWKLGAIPNLISPKCAPLEMRAILEAVRPKLFIGVDPPAGSDVPWIRADAMPAEQLSAEPLPSVIAPHWKAMTSGGSTGRPKVIVDERPGIWNPAKEFLFQRPGDVILNPGPLYHNAPFFCIHAGLFSGAKIIEMEKFDPLRTLELIERHRVNWLTLVPTMMHRIWRLGPEILNRYDLSSLRVMFHMAAPCPAWLKDAWITLLGGDRIYEYYGSTERIGYTVITGTEWLARRGSVGRVQPGSDLGIFADAMQACAPGEVGEIFFRPHAGAGSSYHYIGSTAKRVGDWEATGDLGWLDEEGYLYLSDRRSDLIISGGSNIYPAEVEAAIDEHPEVRTSAVIGLPDEEWGAKVHAIVQLADGARLDGPDLLAFLADRLTRFKLPKTIEFTTLPLRDDAGKVRRAALRAERLIAADPPSAVIGD